MSAERKQKIKEMKAICIPEEKRRSEAAVVLLFMEIGFLFTRLFVKTRVTPNQITWMWGILLIFSACLFLFHDPWLNVLGAALWIIGYALDDTDGQVARYKKQYSNRGPFLDLINHCITYPALFFCIGMGQYFATGDIHNVAVGFVAGLSMLLAAMLVTLHNSVSVDSVSTVGGLQVEEKAFANKKRYKLMRTLNPMTFFNVFLILLAVTLLDIFLPEIFPALFPFEFLWMINFIQMFLVFYAVGFMVGFLVRAGILYKGLGPVSR